MHEEFYKLEVIDIKKKKNEEVKKHTRTEKPTMGDSELIHVYYNLNKNFNKFLRFWQLSQS